MEENKINILDGSIGNYLELNFKEFNKENSWMSSINNNNRNKLIELYNAYISNGSNIITTNTFRTNPFMNSDWVKDASAAVAICKEVKAKSNNILIAGSNPPAEDCYTKRGISFERVKDNHINHINLLYHSGVDFILNETISHMDEISIIEKHCYNSNINYGISLYYKDLKLLDGTYLTTALSTLDEIKKVFVGINCITPVDFKDYIDLVSSDKKLKTKNRFGFYLNNYSSDSDHYDLIKEGIKLLNPILVGGCCYTDPNYILKINKILKE